MDAAQDVPKEGGAQPAAAGGNAEHEGEEIDESRRAARAVAAAAFGAVLARSDDGSQVRGSTPSPRPLASDASSLQGDPVLFANITLTPQKGGVHVANDTAPLADTKKASLGVATADAVDARVGELLGTQVAPPAEKQAPKPAARSVPRTPGLGASFKRSLSSSFRRLERSGSQLADSFRRASGCAAAPRADE
uniref:Uncharacterized protein n=1 Tax=Chlamydomonas euryale TaxID=1486919 RepID=A0A7R9VJJ2_9CHLO